MLNTAFDGWQVFAVAAQQFSELTGAASQQVRLHRLSALCSPLSFLSYPLLLRLLPAPMCPLSEAWRRGRRRFS